MLEGGLRGKHGLGMLDQADIRLGNFFEGSIAAMKSKGHSFKSQMTAAGLAVKVCWPLLFPLFSRAQHVLTLS